MGGVIFRFHLVAPLATPYRLLFQTFQSLLGESPAPQSGRMSVAAQLGGNILVALTLLRPRKTMRARKTFRTGALEARRVDSIFAFSSIVNWMLMALPICASWIIAKPESGKIV